jgi:hypothetical protein
MTTITLTRHYSGFRNVADWYTIGSNEQDGNAAAKDYVLPEGYHLDDGPTAPPGGVIRDPDGDQCEILAGRHAPMLIHLVRRRDNLTLTPA